MSDCKTAWKSQLHESYDGTWSLRILRHMYMTGYKKLVNGHILMFNSATPFTENWKECFR